VLLVRLLMVMFRGKLYDARVTEPVRVDLPDWIRTLAASHPFGVADRRGTANLIDAAARARAAACVRTGNSVSLAHPAGASGAHQIIIIYER
jgi:hypothetical protein